jgi:hypothetical protein
MCQASLVKKAKSRQSDVDYVAAILCLAALHKNHMYEPNDPDRLPPLQPAIKAAGLMPGLVEPSPFWRRTG